MSSISLFLTNVREGDSPPALHGRCTVVRSQIWLLQWEFLQRGLAGVFYVTIFPFVETYSLFVAVVLSPAAAVSKLLE